MSQTQRFRDILFPEMLYETLRNYYSVDSEGQVNWLYKYCACLVQPLQAPWNTYDTVRRQNGLLANSKFQIGDLINVLNYLYDNVLNRIFITQGYYDQTVARTFTEPAIAFAETFTDTAILFAREFGDPVKFVGAIIHVPSTANVSALTATVSEIAILGCPYTIVTF